MTTCTDINVCVSVCGGIIRAARRLVKHCLAGILSTVCCAWTCQRFRTRRRLFGALPHQLVHGIKLVMANYHPINHCKCWAFVNSVRCKKYHRFTKWNPLPPHMWALDHQLFFMKSLQSEDSPTSCGENTRAWDEACSTLEVRDKQQTVLDVISPVCTTTEMVIPYIDLFVS